MRTKLRKFTFVSQIAFFLFVLLLCPPPTILDAGELRVLLERATLSVTAKKVPLQTVLLELTKDGVAVRIDPQINPLITVNFKSRPIEQALETILKPASYSLLWESRFDNSGNKAIWLTEIQIFQSERKDQMKPLVFKRTAEIIKNSAGVFYVKDELLLYLPLGIDLQKLEKLLQAYGATLNSSNIRLPGAIRILLPPNSDVFAIAREIKKKLNIGISQPNYAYPLESPVVHQVSSKQININPGSYVPTDNNAPIAILDSGLADNDDLDKFVMASLDVVDPGAQITDTLGHGTQMAYIASGIIKPYGSDDMSYIPVISIRAFDENGYTTDYNIMNSINYALANNARVMSLSWGSETRSDFMEKAFEYAHSQGMMIVASAGNQPTGKPVYPAAYPAVIGVGALAPHGKTWENSNYGNFVTLYAPGFADLPVGYKGEPGVYAGTSISAALVANSIAGYMSKNPAATQQEIQNFLNDKY